jgi:hypothetical protein
LFPFSSSICPSIRFRARASFVWLWGVAVRLVDHETIIAVTNEENHSGFCLLIVSSSFWFVFFFIFIFSFFGHFFEKIKSAQKDDKSWFVFIASSF